MKPVISFKERCEWIQKESQFKLELARLQLKQKKLDEKLKKLRSEATESSQSV